MRVFFGQTILIKFFTVLNDLFAMHHLHSHFLCSV